MTTGAIILFVIWWIIQINSMVAIRCSDKFQYKLAEAKLCAYYPIDGTFESRLPNSWCYEAYMNDEMHPDHEHFDFFKEMICKGYGQTGEQWWEEYQAKIAKGPIEKTDKDYRFYLMHMKHEQRKQLNGQLSTNKA